MNEFKIFKWYRPNKSSSCIYYYLGNNIGNGFLNGEWVEKIPMKNIDNWYEVETCVIQEALRKEAVKRGLIPGKSYSMECRYLENNIQKIKIFIRQVPGGKLYFSGSSLHTGKTREIVFDSIRWADTNNLYSLM